MPAHQCSGVMLTLHVRDNSIRQLSCQCSLTAGHWSVQYVLLYVHNSAQHHQGSAYWLA